MVRLYLICVHVVGMLPWWAAAQSTIQLQADSIAAEGKMLYRLEMAAWTATDIMLDRYKQPENIGGYFSYLYQATSVCVFFDKKQQPEVIATIRFDSTFHSGTAGVDFVTRPFLPDEKAIFNLRQKALAIINADTLYKVYQGTQLNIIPIVGAGQSKVYVLTGPQEHGVVIFGNDYLLTFNGQNELIHQRALHQNIIPVAAHPEGENGQQVAGTMHSHTHETGELITATDICTLLLYGGFTSWQVHQVVSADYISKWDCILQKLTIIPVAAGNKKSKKNP